MIKVRFWEMETDKFFESKMPVIPQRKDIIDCHIDGQYGRGIVESISHEFDEKGKFKFVEIGLIIQ